MHFGVVALVEALTVFSPSHSFLIRKDFILLGVVGDDRYGEPSVFPDCDVSRVKKHGLQSDSDPFKADRSRRANTRSTQINNRINLIIIRINIDVCRRFSFFHRFVRF